MISIGLQTMGEPIHRTSHALISLVMLQIHFLIRVMALLLDSVRSLVREGGGKWLCVRVHACVCVSAFLHQS